MVCSLATECLPLPFEDDSTCVTSVLYIIVFLHQVLTKVHIYRVLKVQEKVKASQSITDTDNHRYV